MQAIRLGAVDFMTKPVVFERMQVSVANAFKLDSLTQELKRTRSSQKSHILLSDMVTKSPEMEKVAMLARRVTPLDTPLLIEGEVGTGKETLARAISSGGTRWQGPFVAIDCRSLAKAMPTDCCSGIQEQDQSIPLRRQSRLRVKSQRRRTELCSLMRSARCLIARSFVSLNSCKPRNM